jgi:hypothetical protein
MMVASAGSGSKIGQPDSQIREDEWGEMERRAWGLKGRHRTGRWGSVECKGKWRLWQ